MTDTPPPYRPRRWRNRGYVVHVGSSDTTSSRINLAVGSTAATASNVDVSAWHTFVARCTPRRGEPTVPS